ncbi:ribose transport system permease protein [Clostridium collagenovorans DSM 3089]|uniref:Ribose transport system permease protein n=1 Tax=Clostridium collagenovorans DSM 3089 TaxID=1121306 RepID=A0A1M5Y3Q4_9CLOT|nr:ribose ABC transporter permease [Clostridium collagenovorans]SHI06444.1 ribose transport system permease protein [Clostridium collagenovorans DSM 3089]
MKESQAMEKTKSNKIDFKELIIKYKSLVGLILLVVVVSILSPAFLSTKNILNVLKQTSVNAIIAAGMTFVILTGGIDLSVGSILAISGAFAASLLVGGHSIIIAVIVAILGGALVGFLNGIVISKGKLQPFIATLATMTILRGATLVFTDGKPITLGSNDIAMSFGKIGGGSILGIPAPVIIMVLVFIVCFYILNSTKTGRYTYALGSNEEATKLSGISTDKIKIWVYTISGILAAIAGVIITSRLYSAQPTAGTGYELDAIAAVVLGGTSLSGGKGKITGTIIGALIIGVLSNALNILDVSSYYQMIVKGIVILIAVLLDRKSN